MVEQRLRAAREALLGQGFAVVDGCIGVDDANSIQAALSRLHDHRALKPHRFGFKQHSSAPPQVFVKPGIFEAELPDAPVQACAPDLVDTLARLDLQGAAASAFPELALLRGSGSVTVKLQYNDGSGGCFPHHFDNAGPPSRRKLSILCYFNPQWREGDGGEIELVPWLRPAVAVPPLHGREWPRCLERVAPALCRRRRTGSKRRLPFHRHTPPRSPPNSPSPRPQVSSYS